MNTTNLFSLLEDFNEDLNESVYQAIEKNLIVEEFKQTEILVDIGNSVNYFYYVHKGQAWGFSNRHKTSWFCSGNEIILFDRSLLDGTSSSFRIVVDKGSVIYGVHKCDLYKTNKKSIVNNMFANHLIANTSYFLGLNDMLKGLSLIDKISLLIKRHPEFVLHSPLSILSTFLDASIGRVSSIRALLKTYQKSKRNQKER